MSDAWRYGLLGGLVSLPFMTASYWQTGSELSLGPVVFGGLLAGYLAKRGTGTSRGVGYRAGAIGALPTLWMMGEVVLAARALAGPAWYVVVGTLFAVGAVLTVALLGFGLGAISGEVGARIGGWFAGRGEGPTPPAAGA